MTARILLIIISVFMLYSCKTSISVSDLTELQKGMNESQVASQLDRKPDNSFSIESGTGETIKVQIFRLATGDYDSVYLVSFRNGELIWWGYPHEYARENNDLLNKIAEEAAKYLLN